MISEQQKLVIKFYVDAEKMNSLFETELDIIKDRLPGDLVKRAMKGMRTLTAQRVAAAAGGYYKVFKKLIDVMIIDEIRASHRDVMFIDNAAVIKKDSSKYEIQAGVYTIPEVEWTNKIPGIDHDFQFNGDTEVTDENVNLAVDARLNELADKHSTFVKIDKADDNSLLVVSCNASIDGVRWAPGCVNNAKWVLNKEIIKHSEIYNALLGSKVGDVKNVDLILDESYGPRAGKTVNNVITVWDVSSRIRPGLNNDLAISCGYDSYDNMVANLKTTCRATLEESVLRETMDSMIKQVCAVANVPDMPDVWLYLTANRIYEESAKSMTMGDEENLKKLYMRILGNNEMPNKDDIIAHIKSEVNKQSKQDVSMFEWGLKNKIEYDSKTENLNQYLIGKVYPELRMHINKHNKVRAV